MKKITGLLLAAVLGVATTAAAKSTNTMKMVSYFPVPYVAYDTVYASETMDIGILDKCNLDLGLGTSTAGGEVYSLLLSGDPNGADVRRGLLNVSAGKLDLNSKVSNALIKSNKVWIGEGGTVGTGWLDVELPEGKKLTDNALYLGSLKNIGNSLRVKGDRNDAGDVAANVTSFHMFDEIANDFPSCGGTVTWQELEIGADVNTGYTYKEVFLVCGGAGTPIPDEGCPNEPIVKTKSELCSTKLGSKYTGVITYTWNSSSCSWEETSRTCQIALKRYLSYPSNCLQFCAPINAISGGAVGSCSSFIFQTNPAGGATVNPGLPYVCQMRGGVYEYVTSLGYQTTLPSGCSPGQECPSCTLGQRYIVAPSEVFCKKVGTTSLNGDIEKWSMAVVTCMESATSPTAGTLDCSNYLNPGTGGSSGIIPNPGPEIVRP